MTRFSSHSIAPLGAGVVSLMLSACASHPAPRLVPPNAPVASAEHVLLDETFQSYSPDLRQVRGHWAVTSGRLLQTRDDMRDLNTVLFYDPLSVSDAEITADAAMLSDMPQFPIADDAELLRTRRQVGGAGIVFRYQDENNFYLFRLAGEDGVVLGKVVDGAWHQLAICSARRASAAKPPTRCVSASSVIASRPGLAIGPSRTSKMVRSAPAGLG